MKAKYLILMGVLSACSSLHNTVFEGVHAGDTEQSVVQKLGRPDGFESDNDTKITNLVYKKGGDVCAVSTENGVVKSTACKADETYKGSVAARFFKGFADGYNSSRSRNLSCVTTQSGPIATTNCN